MVTTDQVVDALTTKMTGEQLAERLNAPNREVIPVAAALHREGLIGRVVNGGSVASFVPLGIAPELQAARPDHSNACVTAATAEALRCWAANGDEMAQAELLRRETPFGTEARATGPGLRPRPAPAA